MLYFLQKDFWNQPWMVVVFVSSLLMIIFLRYVAFAGLYHAILKRFSTSKRLIYKFKKIQVRREIRWSFLSSIVFTVFSACCVWAYQQGLTQVYVDLGRYPIWYFCVSPFLILFLYETYYYWLHRLMHVPSVFKIVHKVHHESLHPTVFTSFSFHPLEAVMQFLFFPIVVFFVPIHFSVLFGVLILMTVSAVVNHSGVEIFHRKFLLKHLIGSSHHDLHHLEFKSNFGLYFTWWDRIMHTESKNNIKIQK